MIYQFYQSEHNYSTIVHCQDLVPCVNIYLQCHRGVNSICVDWTEICDGRIDCLNNAIDEEQCCQL